MLNSTDSFLLSTLNADCGTPECRIITELTASIIKLNSDTADEEACKESVMEQAYNKILQCISPSDDCIVDQQEIDDKLIRCSEAIFRKKFAQEQTIDIRNIQSRIVTETFAELGTNKVVAMETCITAWKRIRDAAQAVFTGARNTASKKYNTCISKVHIPNQQDLSNCATACAQRSAVRTDIFGYPRPFTPAELADCIKAELKIFTDKYEADKKACRAVWDADYKRMYGEYKAQIVAASLQFHNCCKDNPKDQSCLDYKRGVRQASEPIV